MEVFSDGTFWAGFGAGVAIAFGPGLWVALRYIRAENELIATMVRDKMRIIEKKLSRRTRRRLRKARNA